MKLTPEQLAAIDTQTVITIRGAELAEPEHLTAALKRVATFCHVERATIFVNPREESGWIEYVVQSEFRGGGGITVGVIQRTPGADVEYHS